MTDKPARNFNPGADEHESRPREAGAVRKPYVPPTAPHPFDPIDRPLTAFQSVQEAIQWVVAREGWSETVKERNFGIIRKFVPGEIHIWLKAHGAEVEEAPPI